MRLPRAGTAHSWEEGAHATGSSRWARWIALAGSGAILVGAAARAEDEPDWIRHEQAVREGDLEGAKEHLLASARHRGSPQLDSFGPNMSLAKDLLEKGEKEAVLEYLELCRSFWEMGGDELTAWSSAIRKGRVPDFGANLDY